MKIIKVFLLSIIILITVSCYDYLEVDKIAIVEGIAIDYKNNEYYVSVEIIDIKEENENSYLLDGNSKKIEDTFNLINDKSPKKLSMSHLKTVIISKEVITNHINDISDYLINNNDITTNFYLVYSDDPHNILNNNNQNHPINTKNIADILDKNKNKKYKFDYIISSIKNNKKYEIPIVFINNNDIKIDKKEFINEK